MNRHKFQTTEFPLCAAPVLDDRPFTKAQLYAFELFVNGLEPMAAIRAAVDEHHSLRSRGRRLLARLRLTRSDVSLVAMMLVIGFGPATIYNLTTR